jgi:hypothetical protein
VHARIVVLFAALGCACFSDPPPVEESGTTGASCSVGANMCPCTDGGACDDGLVCHGPLQLCYDPGCTPGTDGCTCDGDGCDEGLRCNEGLCETHSENTSTSTSTTTDDVDATTALADAGSDDGGDTEVLDPCRMCLAGQSTNCATQYGPCATDKQCLIVAMCIMGGSDAGACCTQTMSDAAWDAFVTCAFDACEDACMPYVVMCGGGG